MNNTIDLSCLLNNSDPYLQRWKSIRDGHGCPPPTYSNEVSRFTLSGKRGERKLDITVIKCDKIPSTLEVCLRNGHGKSFPLNAVPMDSPFKKEELVKGWADFIRLFPPIEIEDIPQVYAYDE